MLLTNLSRLLPITSNPIDAAALQIQNGTISWFGPAKEAPKDKTVFDCAGGTVTPGLVDCHTHLVHAGGRQKEYALRAEGKSYLEIAKEGGGILSTVAATRQASHEALLESAVLRAKEALQFGTTTLECKSGYGLDVATELKLLQVAQDLQQKTPQRIVSTFMGAHTIPTEYKKNRKAYLDLILQEMLPKVASLGGVVFCDIFVEQEAFTPEEAKTLFAAAGKYGLKPKLHVDQLHAGAGAELAAAVHAVSADHLEHISEAGMQAMRQSGTVAVLLPGASFFLGVPPAPAKRLLDTGLPVALATDYNPGTNPSLNLMLTATQAVSLLKMSVDAVWKGITWNAASALGLQGSIGSIEVGKQADLVLWDAPDEVWPLYRYGKSWVKHVWIKGESAFSG